MSTLGIMINRIVAEVRRPDLMDHIEEAVRSAIADTESDPMPFTIARMRINTIANQELYVLPTDLKDSAGAAIAAGEDLLTIDTVVNRTGAGAANNLRQTATAWLELYTAQATAGTPLFWARVGPEFRIGPKPSGVLNLYLSGVKRLTTLSGPTIGNAWMTEGEKLIRERAKLYLARDILRDVTAAQAAQVAASEALTDLKRRLQSQMTQPWSPAMMTRGPDTQVAVQPAAGR